MANVIFKNGLRANYDAITMFNSLGLKTKTERGKRTQKSGKTSQGKRSC